VAPKKLFVTVDPFVCGKDKDDEEISISAQRGLHNVVTCSRHRAGRPVAVRHGAGVPRSVRVHSQSERLARPTAGVDMTSAVKAHGDARTGRVGCRCFVAVVAQAVGVA
jgi:hypothetical protein